MRLPSASLRLTDVDIVDLTTYLALIFIVDLHDLNFLLAIASDFILILCHEVRPDAQLSDLLWRFHLDHHVIEDKEGLIFDSFEGLEDVAVLLAIEIKRILGWILLLELINWVGRSVPTSEAMTCMRSPPSLVIFAKRYS